MSSQVTTTNILKPKIKTEKEKHQNLLNQERIISFLEETNCAQFYRQHKRYCNSKYRKIKYNDNAITSPTVLHVWLYIKSKNRHWIHVDTKLDMFYKWLELSLDKQRKQRVTILCFMDISVKYYMEIFIDNVCSALHMLHDCRLYFYSSMQSIVYKLSKRWWHHQQQIMPRDTQQTRKLLNIISAGESLELLLCSQ